MQSCSRAVDQRVTATRSATSADERKDARMSSS